MIKGCVLLFNLLGLFLCRLFFPVSVNVSQTVPSSAEINSSFLVQVTINKSNVKGIAKFTEQMPSGFTVDIVDNGGAKTSFDNNTIQFSWDSLTDANVLNIAFKVTVTSSALVHADLLMGRFLYTANNEKLEADCDPADIVIKNSAATQAGGADTNAIITNQTAGAGQTNNVTQSAASTGGGNVNTGGVFVVRQVSTSADTKITLAIHKRNTTGFAKIEDTIPQGYTATSMGADGASFSFVDRIAKFVWQNLPSDSVITVSYRISASGDAGGAPAISGSFSYLNGGVPASCVIGTATFNAPAITEEVKPQNTIAAGADKANVTPTIPEPVKGLNYRVQVMALHKPVDVVYFSSKKKVNVPVNTEMDGGYTKYTVGNYTDYKSVRDAREDIRNKGIKGPFVVSYNSGARVTVQEALMISHQQWYK